MVRRKQETSLFRLTFKDFATFVVFSGIFWPYSCQADVSFISPCWIMVNVPLEKKAFPFVNSIKGYVFRTMVFIYTLILAVYLVCL